jgi:aminoglycoside phosphotransferase (APT) family kinase protein
MENKENLPPIDEFLVRKLIAAQFPQWKDFTVLPVARSGWDNRTFHLGEHMLVRLPSAINYAAQVEKEHLWLPKLAPLLPLPIPAPLAVGEPAYGYPWKWSIYNWLQGEAAASAEIADLCEFATGLAGFLTALQKIDATGGPLAGTHSFYRGGALSTYDDETRRAIKNLSGKINEDAALDIWDVALATSWQDLPVWVHGDISAGNLLVQGGQLSAVIDFGQLAVGDPACDLAIAWTMFDGKSREAFRSRMSLDSGTWARGRAWTLWKALIVAARLTDTNAIEGQQSLHIIDSVIADHKNCV